MSSNSAGIGGLLPPQTSDLASYILTTDGQTASWEVSSASLPTQTGQSGKFLTTNGTVASWGTVSTLPTQTGQSGKFLTTNGTTASWGDASGVTLAAFSSTPSADGLTLSTGVLNMDPADGTRPGGVSTTTQTFAGVKTFSSVPVAAGISAPTTSGFTLSGNVTTGGSAVGVTIDNLVALTTAGAKIASFQNHEVEKVAIDKDGGIHTDAGIVGVTTGQTNFALVATAGYAGVWLGANADTPSATNVAIMDVSGVTRVNAVGGQNISLCVGGTQYWLVNASTGNLDSALAGKGIKFISPDGNTTKILTIDNAGAAVWT